MLFKNFFLKIYTIQYSNTSAKFTYIIYAFREYIFLIYIYLMVILWYLKNKFIFKWVKITR